MSFTNNKSEPQNAEQYFKTDHLKADLKGRTVRGGAVTVISQISKQVLGLGSTVVLARLLTPQDYGLLAMVTAVTGFVAMFKDMGLSMATVQRPEISQEQISTLFWVNVALGIAIFFVTVGIAPFISWYYGEPKLTLITIYLAIGFIFGGLTVQHQALLRRQMRFTSIAFIDISAVGLGIAVGIGSALFGMSYWALIFMILASTLTTAVGTWMMCHWRPGRPQHIGEVRSMLSFGGNLTGFNVVNYFARNLDNLLIGKFFGAKQLGLYSKAYQLLLLPLRQINGPVSSVAVPALSRLADSPELYRRTYLRILEKISILTMPAVAYMIVTSDWLILLILGPQWTEASRIFALLGIVGLVQPISNTTGWLFITQDRTRDMFKWGIIGSAISIGSIIAGLPWGAVGVAASYAIVGLFFQSPLLYWYVGREGPIRNRDFYITAAPAMCASSCVFIALIVFRKWVQISNPLTGLSVALGITVLIALSVFVILPAGRRALSDIWALIPSLYQRPEKA